MKALALICLWVALSTGALSAQVLDEHLPPGPFPVPGQVYGPSGEQVGLARVYPRYVELFDQDNKFLGKVGVIPTQGVARLQLVNADKGRTLVGYAKKGRIYDEQDQLKGTYFWTPTYSFVYDPQGRRVGSTKCIAWPRVCSVGVAGFLLGLLDAKEADHGANP